MSKPVPTLVTYKVKKGEEEAFLPLLEKHWPTLRELGLVLADDRPRYWRAVDKRTGEVSFVELFAWKDEGASDVAHQTPEVMAIWEPMGPILEGLEIRAVEALDLGH